MLTTSMRSLALLAALAWLGGCESDSEGWPTTASQGSSSNAKGEAVSVFIDLTVTAEPPWDIANPARATDFDTRFVAEVWRGGAVVQDARVVVTAPSGDKVLTFVPDPNDTQRGQYEGSHAGYSQVYKLALEAGADKLTDIVFVGPEVFLILHPTREAPLEAGAPIAVEWENPDPASDPVDEVTVSAASYTSPAMGGSATTHEVPAGSLSGDHPRVSVTRTKFMALENGGTHGGDGSGVRVRLRQSTGDLEL